MFFAAFRAKHGRAPEYVEKGCDSDSPTREGLGGFERIAVILSDENAPTHRDDLAT